MSKKHEFKTEEIRNIPSHGDVHFFSIPREGSDANKLYKDMKENGLILDGVDYEPKQVIVDLARQSPGFEKHIFAIKILPQ